MRTQHPISWNNKVNIAAETLLEVFFPSLSLTLSKLGTTRLVNPHPDTDAPFEEHVITVSP